MEVGMMTDIVIEIALPSFVSRPRMRHMSINEAALIRTDTTLVLSQEATEGKKVSIYT